MLDNKRNDMRRKSELLLNYNSSIVDFEAETKVEKKIQFFSSVKVKLFKSDEEVSPDRAKTVKFVKLKS